MIITQANPLPIIIAVLAVIVLAIAAFYITRMMKGKIELQMSKTGFNSGEAVTGTFTLTTKKNLDVRRLYVALIGFEVTERRESDGNKRTDRKEIFRDEENFEESQILPSGFSKTYNFALNAPGSETVGNSRSGGGMEISIGSLTLGSNNNRRLEWKVEARADLPGVDIASSKSVRINVT